MNGKLPHVILRQFQSGAGIQCLKARPSQIAFLNQEGDGVFVPFNFQRDLLALKIVGELLIFGDIGPCSAGCGRQT